MKGMTNTKIADALKRAKEFLIEPYTFPKPNQSRYICYALRFAIPKDASQEIVDAHLTAENIVAGRIRKFALLETWVVVNVPGAALLERTDYAGFQNEMQAYRHRWLDALIKEFSE